MQNTAPTFDVSAFKTFLDESPTQDNGWKLDHDGPIKKDSPGNTTLSLLLFPLFFFVLILI